MPLTIFLDTGVLGLLTRNPAHPDVRAANKWVADCSASGSRVYVPEISDYEIRRELIRAGKIQGVERLDAFVTGRYVAINTSAMQFAALLWATARNAGVPTASKDALDADVILAAQALTLGFAVDEIVVATTNIRHLRRFVPSDLWQNIGTV